ncbi:putative O-glycosylation ligase, exosortase A system-associated [Skermanella sp. TT6]|uniref:O-glycosylation ligase, exosortase A system-associated n=1 Tax=Skermanella cutis TaxID=2775420 RepID=A0ABX7B4D4_9PROT|nr:putative O-glycosylation ligase, exosortase A system-associated [Skermanella sp. TT6]QQP88685.1 putative O-glycosylation ligase, exosortase A system-associated [Skermanella sp. TT6]
MRSLILFMLFLVLAVMALTMPAVGVLTWAWIAIMSPHRLTWDFTYALQLNLVIVVITFIAWLVAREPKRLPLNAATVMIMLFMAWMTLTTATSLAPSNSWFHWDLHIKNLIFALAVAAIMRSQVRIQALIWMITLSIGYFGVKGGGFTIANGGAYTVLGPPQSIIEDRNHLALACCMVIPLMNYLRVTTANRLIKMGLALAMALTIISVIGSYSRGGFLALSVTAFVFWLRSSGKFVTMVLLLASFVPAVTMMPDSWKERIGTIENYQKDESVQGRFDAWNYAMRVAADRPLVGGGLATTEVRQVFQRYVPNRPQRAAHSIYFQVLGDQGPVGLAIFLGIGVVGWLNARSIIRMSRDRPEFEWAFHLGRMMQVSFISYFVAGAALSMAYYSVFFVSVVIVTSVKAILTAAERAERAAAEPAAARVSRGGFLRPAATGAPVG